MLYPLFVNNIGNLLYHPTNQTRTNAVMAAAGARKNEQTQLRTQPPGLPSLHQHHHHSMNNSIGGHLSGGPQHSLAPHPNIGRPGLDRAHTFPTPPTSASSVMGSMGNPDANFQWGPQAMNNVQGGNPLSIDTGLSNARSMPSTPASTPPGTSLQSMQQYQQNGQQPYDNSRQMYSAAPPQQNSYAQSTPDQQMARYQQQPNSYIKNEMGPPMVRAPGTETEHHDVKDTNGMLHHGQSQGHVNHSHAEDEGEHEHDAEYTHGNPTNYDANRGSYSYANGAPVGSLTGEHAHMSPEMAGSPNHPASGRATPRTTSAPQPYYNQQQGYSTPPRVQPPSSNLYNVMSSERGTANGNVGGDVYATQPDMANSIPNGYAAQQPIMNGVSATNKRGRDDEDDGRPESRGPEIDGGLKRRKTIREGSISGPTTYDRPQRAPSAITQRRR